MYLSRLILNPKNGAVRRDLADCQQLHRTIMSAFPRSARVGEGARAGFGVLHRVDADPPTGEITLYVQSRVPPDWSRLEPGYLLEEPDGRENPACKSVAATYGRLREGMVLRFRLRANPTRKIDTKTGPDGRRRHGRRVELRTEAQHVEWLQRKAQAGGFELVTVRVNPRVPDALAIPQGKSERLTGLRQTLTGRDVRRLTLAAVLFDGHLCIVDMKRFRATLENGIGPGKAYGFGLLSVAPPGG